MVLPQVSNSQSMKEVVPREESPPLKVEPQIESNQVNTLKETTLFERDDESIASGPVTKRKETGSFENMGVRAPQRQ